MFTIVGLDPARLADGVGRTVIADGDGYPCRVSLIDAAPGEVLLLFPFAHHDVDSPYRASGPIYVRKDARVAARFVGEVPEVLRRRLLSVRAYDARGDLRDAEVVPGTELAALVGRWFADAEVAYLHVHGARPGCYLARVDRTTTA